MPTYFFHIRKGKYASAPTEGIELPDLDAARKEAAMMCSDMVRDIVSELDRNPEWQMVVTDQSGQIIYRLSLIAESVGEA